MRPVEVSGQRGPFRPSQQHETQIAVHSVNSASSAKEPRGGKDPRRPTASMAELALMARVRKGNRKTCDRETAEEALIWALEVATCGPTGLMERRPYLKLGPVCRGFVALAVASIAVFLLLTMARVGFREVSTRDGLLLAAGVPAYKGEELMQRSQLLQLLPLLSSARCEAARVCHRRICGGYGTL